MPFLHPKAFIFYIFFSLIIKALHSYFSFINKFVYICSMNKLIEKFKGIHPGFILEHILKKRMIRQRPFAMSINEHPQTLNAITKGRRNLNTALALKIEDKLELEEGTLALLQTYFDISKEKEKQETASRRRSHRPH